MTDRIAGFKLVRTLPEGEVVISMVLTETTGELLVATTRRVYTLRETPPLEPVLEPLLFRIEEASDGPG